jgi:formate/nitrite transporter FocA (FNT family)
MPNSRRVKRFFRNSLKTTTATERGLPDCERNINLLPVTIGNILGGAVLVGIVYWFVYLRNRLFHPS